jgi:hypothetical protein
MNPLMKDLNRRLAGKKRPDSLRDVELSLAEGRDTKPTLAALTTAGKALVTAKDELMKIKGQHATDVAVLVDKVKRIMRDVRSYDTQGLSLGLPEEINKDYQVAMQIDTLLRRFGNAGKNPDVDKLVEQMNGINARLIKTLKADIQDAKASA